MLACPSHEFSPGRDTILFALRVETRFELYLAAGVANICGQGALSWPLALVGTPLAVCPQRRWRREDRDE